MGSRCAVRTLLKDLSPEDDEERGVRSWRAAELVGEAWFVVEHCVDVGGTLEVRQWVVTAVQDWSRLLVAEAVQWSRVLAYVRLPLSAGAGFVFGELADLHEMKSSGRRLLRFTNGTTVMVGRHDGSSSDVQFGAEELRLVFSKSPVARDFICGGQ
jgi:hypothetical protein